MKTDLLTKLAAVEQWWLTRLSAHLGQANR